VETGQGDESTEVTATVEIDEAFVVGKLQAPEALGPDSAQSLLRDDVLEECRSKTIWSALSEISFSRTNDRAIMAVLMRARRRQNGAFQSQDNSALKGFRRRRGLRTRRAILRKAVDLASLEGLEGLTIGRLASTLRISKSGLFAHFGSKEDLQCAVVDEARDIFVESVVRPAFNFRGLQRLRVLCENWLSYGKARVFPGGCFFSAASLEFDDRPGRVRDQIVELMKKWLGHLEQAARDAQSAGEIRKEVDVQQLAFEIQALAMGANWSSRLFRSQDAFRAASAAISQRIDQAAEPMQSRR
jgi:AcrR family transcriptional regulator